MSELVWRYTSNVAKVRHAIEPGRPAALCGVAPVWFSPGGWRGEDNDEQRERLATLRECRRCRMGVMILSEQPSVGPRPM